MRFDVNPINQRQATGSFQVGKYESQRERVKQMRNHYG